MALLTEHSIFIHVPGTGGYSVRRMIKAAGIETQHETGDPFAGIPELLALHKGIERGRVVFGFVRNPVAWLRNRWAWAVMTGLESKARDDPDAAAHWIMACWHDTFEGFAARVVERYPGIATQTMYRMLGLWPGNGARVTHLCQTEMLQLHLASVLKQSGETFDSASIFACGRENVRASGELVKATHVKPKTADRIIAAEHVLAEQFGYTAAP